MNSNLWAKFQQQSVNWENFFSEFFKKKFGYSKAQNLIPHRFGNANILASEQTFLRIFVFGIVLNQESRNALDPWLPCLDQDKKWFLVDKTRIKILDKEFQEILISWQKKKNEK